MIDESNVFPRAWVYHQKWSKVARGWDLGQSIFEHLSEWFRGSAATPPLRVLLIQLAHLVLLVGLAIAWRWELAGSVLIILGALAFFSQAAGRNFPLFFGVTIIPAILYAFCWRKSWM